MSLKANYDAAIRDLNKQSVSAKKIFINAQFSGGGLIESDADRAVSIAEAMKEEPMFENLSDASRQAIGSSWGSSIRKYADEFGETPRDDVLANAMASVGAVVLGDKKTAKLGGLMLEALDDTATAEGVPIRDHMIAMILPVHLAMVTNDAVTMMPTAKDSAEIFRIRSKTKTAFGDFDKNTILDGTQTGIYSIMRQRHAVKEVADGTRTTFTFNPVTDTKAAQSMPIKTGRTQVYLNNTVIATETDSQFNSVQGASISIDSGASSINHDTGAITIELATAPATGVEVSVRIDINIEEKPELTPQVTQMIESKKIYPYEYSIATEQSVWASIKSSREFGVDLNALNMQAMVSSIATEKANKHLEDIRFATVYAEPSWDSVPANGMNDEEHEHSFKVALSAASTNMLKRNKKTGIRGMYAAPDAVNVIKNMRSFVYAPNYIEQPVPHYVGTYMGKRVYCVPQWEGDHDGLIQFYGRGQNFGETGYVAGDAIPPQFIDEQLNVAFLKQDAIFGSAYGEIHPIEGIEYFSRMLMTHAG